MNLACLIGIHNWTKDCECCWRCGATHKDAHKWGKPYLLLTGGREVKCTVCKKTKAVSGYGYTVLDSGGDIIG